MLTNFVTKAFRGFFEVILWIILAVYVLFGLIGGGSAGGVLGAIGGLFLGAIVGGIFIIVFGGAIAIFIDMSKNVDEIKNDIKNLKSSS